MNTKPDSIIQQPSGETIIEIEANPNPNQNQDLTHFISECQQKVFHWDEFLTLVQDINSDDQFKRYYGLIGIRKLLRNEEDRFDEGRIQKVIDVGLIPKLLEFIRKDDEPQLQLEATWVLASMTTGTFYQIREVVDQGAAPILVKLLKSHHTQLVEYAARAIAILAYEPQYRDFLLDHEVLHPLIDVLEKALERKDLTFIGRSTRALSNLCRGRPSPDYERVADATRILCCVIKEIDDNKILEDALSAVSYLSSRVSRISRVLEVDVVPSVIRCLDCPEDEVVIAAIGILGNILIGTDEQADRVLKIPSTRNYIKKMFQLLKQRSFKDIRREICWSLSNIVVQRDSIDLVIGNPEYIKQLINVALYDVFEVQREAAWVLANVTTYANKNQMVSLTRNGVFDCVCKLIQANPPSPLFFLGLKAIKNYLVFGTSMSRKEATNNQYLVHMKQTGAVNRIKRFKGHKNSQVSAFEVWNCYLKGNLLRKKLRLKRAIICFGNERYSLFGLFQNKKKRLCV